MAQLRLGKKSRYAPDEVLQRAKATFGQEGLGLRLIKMNDSEAQFASESGHVQLKVEAIESGGKSEVDIQTRDFEYDVRHFLGKI